MHELIPMIYGCGYWSPTSASEGEWEELAKRFGVSLGYAKKIRKQQLRYGQKERKAQCRHGPVSRVTEAVEKELRDQVGEQPDATLQELGQRLWQRTHIEPEPDALVGSAAAPGIAA